MGDRTGIEWTNVTWNPWMGCHKVSAGCQNCYMFQERRQYGQDPEVVVRSKTCFNAPLKWQRQAPAKERRTMVFTCSWSDFFIQEADPIRQEAWEIIRRCPDLIFQILTKRAERIQQCLPADWGDGWPNVWLGVTAESQEAAQNRIPTLLQVPAAVRFVSCEPLIGPIDLRYIVYEGVVGVDALTGDHDVHYPFAGRSTHKINWVIAGGENGAGARPTHYRWVSRVRDACVDAGIPFFFKGWGAWAPYSGDWLDGQEWHQFPTEAGQ